MDSPVNLNQDVFLLTPGPVSTTNSVRAALVRDYGSRDKSLIDAIATIRRMLLSKETTGVELDPKVWACILLQGPGTMGIEASVSTIAPRTKGKYYLIIQSGKYAERQGACVQRLGIDMLTFETPEGQEIDLMELEKFLSVHRSDIATVGMVHHETSTGMVNDVVAVTALVKRYCGKETSVIVDSISGFGACPLDIPASDVDVVITSPNKSIHGVPGFSIILAKRDLLARRVGNSRSFTLDLCSQLSGLDKNGQFLFTPPVHVLMCFEQALKEFINDGGIAGRQKRYKLHADTAIAGMKRLGFQLFLDPTKSSFGHIVVGFDFPTHKKWNFKTYYETLKDEAKVIIYPGKASTAETFRFGMIGAIDVSHIEKAVMGSESALRKMGIVPGVDDLYPVVPEHKKPGYFQHLLKKKKTMSKL